MAVHNPARAAVNDAPAVAEQFDDPVQQHETGTLGMWIFLATEILLFGGLFLCYTAYRQAYPDAFQLASHHTEFWKGTINTGILLTSSLTMALAVHAAQSGRRGALTFFLVLTMLLGAFFLGIKFWEYAGDYEKHLIPGINFDYRAFASGDPNNPFLPQRVALFFLLYFFMTGLHAIHLTIGIGLVGVMTWLARAGRFSAERYTPIELTGLYWHLVDIVWVFLYPLLYLVGHR